MASRPRLDVQEHIPATLERGPLPDCSDWVKRNCAVCRGLLNILARELDRLEREVRELGEGDVPGDWAAELSRMRRLLEQYREHAEV